MDRYIDHYASQAGGGVDRVFIGAPYQRGHGLGSFLSGLFRRALPLLTRGARVVGKEALHTGMNILDDVAHNTPFKDAFRSRITESGRNLKRKAEEKLESLMKGSGYKVHDRAPQRHSLFGHTRSHIANPTLRALKYIKLSKSKKSTKKKKKVKPRKKRGKTKKKTKVSKRKKRAIGDIFG